MDLNNYFPKCVSLYRTFSSLRLICSRNGHRHSALYKDIFSTLVMARSLSIFTYQKRDLYVLFGCKSCMSEHKISTGEWYCRSLIATYNRSFCTRVPLLSLGLCLKGFLVDILQQSTIFMNNIFINAKT